jgi:hypothetical protein
MPPSPPGLTPFLFEALGQLVLLVDGVTPSGPCTPVLVVTPSRAGHDHETAHDRVLERADVMSPPWCVAVLDGRQMQDRVR